MLQAELLRQSSCLQSAKLKSMIVSSQKMVDLDQKQSLHCSHRGVLLDCAESRVPDWFKETSIVHVSLMRNQHVCKPVYRIKHTSVERVDIANIR